MHHRHISEFEELRRFSLQLCFPAVVTLILNLLGLTTFGLIISVIIHIIVLGVYFLLFKEVKSVLLKLILSALISCLVGEVLVFYNLEHVKYTNEYWVFLTIHFIRHFILGFAFAWNAFKSHKFNPFWIKMIPIAVSVILGVVLHYTVFNYEEYYKWIFFVYNISLCLMLLTCGLRYNHTSDRAFVMMLVAVGCYILSEVFYFWEFLPDEADQIMAAFRAPLLQVGSCVMVAATVAHVIDFRTTEKQRMNVPLTERINERIKDVLLRPRANSPAVKTPVAGKKPEDFATTLADRKRSSFSRERTARPNSRERVPRPTSRDKIQRSATSKRLPPNKKPLEEPLL